MLFKKKIIFIIQGLPEWTLEQMFPPKIEQKFYTEGDGGERGKKSWPKRNCPQCPFCDRRYRDNLGMRQHIARKHPDCINFVQCNKCYKCVKNADELPNHDCESSWLCLECNPIRNMCSAERLQKHRSKFHRGEQSGFQCQECQRKFLTPRRLKQHQKLAHIHHKPYKCGFCMEYFENELAVALHERIHTGKIKYECNICDYKCNRWSRLTEHKQVDHGYLCMQCGDRMMEFEQLKYHTLAQHEGYLSAENQAMFLVSPRLWILYKGE